MDMNRDNWQALNKTFTVLDIMTERDQWEIINLNEISKDDINYFENLNYDATPILENGTINSFILKAEPDKFIEITKDWLISSDTSIPDLLEIFVKTYKPVLFVFQKQDLVGLVTPADLNKIEARLFIYVLIGQLELKLANFIRDKGNLTKEQILFSLSEYRSTELSKMMEMMLEEDVYVDIDLIEQLQFSDLLSIIKEQPVLFMALNYSSTANTHKNLGGLNQLRNNIMHPISPLIQNKTQSLKQLHERISRIEDVFIRLEDAYKNDEMD